MAALNPTGEGLQSAPLRSFAETLSSSRAPTALATSAHPLHAISQTFDDAIAASHKGFPSMLFDDKHISDLSTFFPWTLVGKFSKGYNKTNPGRGRPSVVDLERYFKTLDLKASFSIGLLDNRHLLIRLSSEDDYLRLYSRTVWYVAKVTMRVFKWTPFFTVDRETSLVPVWVSLPRLPVIFFAKPALFRIASLLGSPLRLDMATASLKRPGVARLQIEIDLLKERPNQIWIGMGSETGFWQKIEYEHVPNYCTHCWHVGHAESLCTVHHPELRVVSHGARQETNARQEYRPKEVHPGTMAEKLEKSRDKMPATVPEALSVDVPEAAGVKDAQDQPTQSCTETVARSIFVAPMFEHQSPLETQVQSKEIGFPSQPIVLSASTVGAEAQPQPHEPIELQLTVLDARRATEATNLQHSMIDKQRATELIDRATEGTVQTDDEALLDANLPRKLPVIFCADSDPEENEEISSNQQVPDDQSAPYALASSTEFPLLQSPVPAPKTVSTVQPPISGKSQRLNVDAAVWFPQDRAETSINLDLDRRTLLAQSGRLLPPSFDTSPGFQTEQQFQEWVTDDEPEEEDEEAAMEHFLDSEAVRDDLYIEKRNNTEARRERDIVLLRRGRGCPLGSHTRNYFDLPRQSGRSNKGVPPKHYEPEL